MPYYLNQRIARLRELAQQVLSEENLDRLVRECSSLAQDRPYVLAFFTLKNIFRELSDVLETGAIAVPMHEELVRGISQKASAVLKAHLPRLSCQNCVRPIPWCRSGRFSEA